MASTVIASAGTLVYPTECSLQNKIIWDGTRYWAFYFKPEDDKFLYYSYSTNLTSWTEASVWLSREINEDSRGGEIDTLWDSSSSTVLVSYIGVANNPFPTYYRYMRGVISGTSIKWNHGFDDFNRSNENPLSGGGKWAQQYQFAGPCQIVSNQVCGTSATQDDYGSLYVDNTFTPNQFVRFLFIASSTSNALGCILRGSTTVKTCYYLSCISNGTLTLQKWVAGTYYDMGYYDAGGLYSGDNLVVAITGTTNPVSVSVYLNRTLQHTWTDDGSTYGDLITSGSPGVYSGSTGDILDYVSLGDIDFGVAGYGEDGWSNMQPTFGLIKDSANKVIYLGHDSTGNPDAFRSTNNIGATFADTGTDWTDTGTGIIADYVKHAVVFPLASQNLLCITNDFSTPNTNIQWKRYNNPDWDANYTVIYQSPTASEKNWGAAQTTNLNVYHLGVSATSTWSFNVWTGSSWSSLTAPAWPTSGLATNSQVALASDGTNVWAVVIRGDGNNSVSYNKYSVGGASWGGWADLEASDAVRTFIEAAVLNNNLVVQWTQVNGSNYDIYVAGLSLTSGAVTVGSKIYLAGAYT
jgi:hypothetical protein